VYEMFSDFDDEIFAYTAMAIRARFLNAYDSGVGSIRSEHRVLDAKPSGG
jgi:hypothetical protein